MKIYNSKHEILHDFQIAVKFRLKYDVSREAYDTFFDALRANDNWRITEFNREVHHLNTHYPVSVGLFAEIPVVNSDGSEIGARFVILEHESGPEFFIAAVSSLLTYTGAKAIGALKDSITQSITTAISSAVRDRWPQLAFRAESPIRYVEIRTASKGVMRIQYEVFTPTQLTCLVRHFSEIDHLSETNATCFGNALFEPEDNYNDNGI